MAGFDHGDQKVLVTSGASADLTSTRCERQRNEIIRTGKALADAGAHYLWGAEGQMPARGGAGGVGYTTVSFDNGSISFCAAQMSGNVCVGRFRHSGLAGLAPMAASRVCLPSSPSIAKFIGDYRNRPDAQYGWVSGLTPRRVNGYAGGGAPVDFEGGSAKLFGKIVWGEGCDAKQHFDCGGFVRYVVKEVCKMPIKGLSGLANGLVLNSRREPMGRLLEKGELVLPADILLYPGHIAFALGDRPTQTYSVTEKFTILQAEAAIYGLNYHKARGGHTHCIRLSDSTLVGNSS